MIQRSDDSLSERAFSRRAYSSAVGGSWIEHGPQMTRRRSSRCSIISTACSRPEWTVSLATAGWTSLVCFHRCAASSEEAALTEYLEEAAKCDSQQRSHSGGTAERVRGHSQRLREIY